MRPLDLAHRRLLCAATGSHGSFEEVMRAVASAFTELTGCSDALLLVEEGQHRLAIGAGVEHAEHRLPLRVGEKLVGLLSLGSTAPVSEEERVLAESAALVLSTFRANDLLRAREDALAVVVHDLRNPINVISLSATTLLQRLTDASARRPLERIVRGVQRAERLIRDLLEVSAIDGGRLAIEQRALHPAELILSVVESQQTLASNAAAIFATDLSPLLPRVLADEQRIHEVLENLVGNAVKFCASGATVTVGASAGEGEVLIWVKDTGPGISAEHLPHLFDRYYQARKQDRRGTGLGLTICKAIVEAHGGRIWAESIVGEGTTMFFTLPAAGQYDALDGVANLLLVDDRPDNLLALTTILARPDYNLITAASGEEALTLALRHAFAVILLDVAMPGMSGLEVAEHLKQLERCRDIPILFITAFGDDPEEIHRAYSAGGADYLIKPLDAEIVRKKVAVFVNLSKRRQLETQRARSRAHGQPGEASRQRETRSPTP